MLAGESGIWATSLPASVPGAGVPASVVLLLQIEGAYNGTMGRPRAASRTPPTRESVELHDGALRLVVVADTHSEPHPRAAALIAELRPDRILHAGDIGDLDVLTELAKIAPLSAIRGNIDVHAPDLPDALTLDVREGPDSLF
jgi:hypothetical protein